MLLVNKNSIMTLMTRSEEHVPKEFLIFLKKLFRLISYKEKCRVVKK